MAREALGRPEAPVISCVMAAHNAEQYLEEAIDSILAQSLRDFELIIVDDGSTDRTSSILSHYAAKDPRLDVLRQDARGLTRSLIAGTARARGRYIARMDADDIAEPERFANQSEYLANHEDCLAVGTSLKLIDPDGEFLAEKSVSCTHDQIVAELLSGHGAIPHPSAMIRRPSLERVGGYRAEFKASQDLDLWLRLTEIGQLANLSDPLLRYRLHDNSITTQKRDIQLACAQRAVRDALRRRGDPRADSFEMSRSSQTSRARTLRGWARMALKSHCVRVARKHAWSAFLDRPLNPSHWWLLARTFV